MKKVFTLLTLLVAIATSAWADALTIKTVDGNTTTWDLTAITADMLSTLSSSCWESKDKGSYYQTKASTSESPDFAEGLTFIDTNSSGTKARLYKESANGFYFGGNAAAMSVAVTAGQTITVTTTGGGGVSSSDITFTVTNSSGTYTSTAIIPAGSSLTTVKFARATGSATYCTSVVVETNQKPTITTQPVSGNYGVGDTPTALSVVAVSSEGTLTYQWYKNTDGDTSAKEGDKIDGATSATLAAANISTASAGTTYYYVVVADDRGSITSSLATIFVGSLYSIVYDLGAGTGTAPTQADLADGATFTVADAPGDLVPPSGKEFKCWNDGADDYDAGDTYTMGTSNVTLTAVYQDRTYKGLTPSETLDLTDATSSTFTTQWYTSRGYKTGYYYDAPNGKAVFSTFAVYQSSTSQTWSTTDSGNSGNGAAWSASGDFKGGAYYSDGEDSKWYWAVVRNTARNFYYRVTGVTSVSALMGGKAIIEAYQVNTGVVTPDPVKSASIDAAGTLSLTELTSSNEYIIVVRGNNGNSNVTFSEIAFYFPAVSTVSITPAKAQTTYVTTYALDFSSVDGLKAYVATGSTTTTVELTSVDEVPVGTPLILKGTAGTEYNVSVVVSADAPATNYLVAGPATINASTASESRYVLSGGKFKKVVTDGVNIPAGKCYLQLDESGLGSSASSLEMNFSEENEDNTEDNTTGIETIDSSKTGFLDGDFYNLSGQRVAQPTKGLYIVNGKKVIVK